MRLLGLALLVALLVVGCDRGDPGLAPNDDGGYVYKRVTLQNGLECIRMSAPYKGGLTCNWEKFNREHPYGQ